MNSNSLMNDIQNGLVQARDSNKANNKELIHYTMQSLIFAFMPRVDLRSKEGKLWRDISNKIAELQSLIHKFYLIKDEKVKP
jgi:hypothetical protein